MQNTYFRQNLTLKKRTWMDGVLLCWQGCSPKQPCQPEMAQYIADISKNLKYRHFSPHIYPIVIVSATNICLILYRYRFMKKMEVNYCINIVLVKQKQI